MSEAAAPPVDVGSRRLVARNTIIMMAAQALGVPLAIVVNAVMARTIGPGDYGIFYVLTTFASLAFMFVDWGQNGILPARIATDRARRQPVSGQRAGLESESASIAATGILGVVLLFQDHRLPLLALALVCLGQALTLIARTCADVVRGFERVKVAAYTQVGGQFLTRAPHHTGSVCLRHSEHVPDSSRGSERDRVICSVAWPAHCRNQSVAADMATVKCFSGPETRSSS